MAALWVPGPLPSLNDLIAAAKGAGGTGRAYSKLKKQWTNDIWAWAKEARLPRFLGRVFLEFRWYEQTTRRDPDNIAAGGRKLVLDGLVAAGVIGGDGWRYVAGWVDRFRHDPTMKAGVEVTIRSADSTILQHEAPPLGSAKAFAPPP